MTKASNKVRGFSSLGDILGDFRPDEDKQGLSFETSESKQDLPARFSQDKYISYEFQKYGYELAKELGDLKNKSLYIKLAKGTPRGLLESARNFVKDASNVESPAKLFMWKLSELRKAKKVNTQEERKR